MDARKFFVLGFLAVLFPSIVSASASLTSPSDGEGIHYSETVTHEISVAGTDGTVELYIDGSFVKAWSHCDSGCSTTYTYDKDYTSSEEGFHSWDAVYYGSTDGSDEDPAGQNYEILQDADFADLTMDSPADGASFSDDSITFDYGVYTDYSGNLELVADTCSGSLNSFNSVSVPGGATSGETYTIDYSGCYGTFDWYPKYTGDDGSTETRIADQFTIESDSSQASLTYNSPNDGATFDGDLNQEKSITYDFDFTGASGDLIIREDGSQLTSFSHSGSSNANYDYTVTNSDGNYDWNVVYNADDGSSEEYSLQSYEIEDYADRTSISLDSPADGASLSSQTVTFEYSGSGEDGDVKLFVDGGLESTKSFSSSSSNTYSTTVDVGGGNHDWYVEYEGDDGSSTSTTSDSFSTPTDAEETTLSADNPSDGASFIGLGSTIDYEGTVSGNSGTVRFYSDTCSASNSEIYSESYAGGSSSTVSYSNSYDCEGTFDWYAEYTGDDGSIKTTSSRSFSISSEASGTTLTADSPSDGSNVSDQSGDVTFDVTKAGYDGNIDLYVDNTLEHTWTNLCNSCTESKSYTVSGLSPGSHDWYAEYNADDGSSKTTSTNTFDLETSTDAGDTTLSLDSPSDGETINQETVEYNYTISGNSGTVRIFRNGTQIDGQAYDGSGSQVFSYSENLSNGDYEYYVEYEGDDGSTKQSSTRSFTVDAPLTSSISLNRPNDGEEYIGTFPVGVEYNFSVTGESGTIELYRDGSIIQSLTHFGGENLDYSYSEDFGSEGVHTYYVKYIRDSDGQTVDSNTRSFSIVQQENVNLNIDSPSDGDVFEHDENISFSYSASSNVEGDVSLMVNGSQVKSSSYNSTGSTSFYEYSTTDLAGSDYNARVRFQSDSDTYYSDYTNFSVKNRPVDYIESVQYNYLGVESGSVDQSIVVDLSGNSSINDYDIVSGDTASFSSDEWVIENVSLPYSDEFVVYDGENRNDSRSIDFNLSVKDVAGHPENSSLSYQEKNVSLDLDNSGEALDFNYSCSTSAYGNSSKVSGLKTLVAGSSSQAGCTWSGDWLSSSSGDFDPLVGSVEVDDDLRIGSWLEVNNSESVSFPSVKYSEALPDDTCRSSEALSITNNSELNQSVEGLCDIGDSGSPQLTIDSSGDQSEYVYNTTLNVSSDLAENISISWSFNKSELQDWSSKNPGSARAFVKGVSDSILLAESSDTVEVIVPDDAFSSSLHEGFHPARVEYVTGDSINDGGSGGGGGDTPRVIRNVTGTYNWSVSAPRSEGQTFYNIVGWSGRDLSNAPTRIVASNNGDNNFSLSVKCVSDDNSCDFVELSKNNLSLDSLDQRSDFVEVNGVIPGDIPDSGYRFNIVFEDPEGETAEANFRVNKNYAQSLIIRFVSKIFGVREVDFDGEGGGDAVPIPLALPVLLITGLFWGLMALGTRFAQNNNMIRSDMDFVRGRLILSVFVFILAFIFI